MSEVAALLAAFSDVTGKDSALWETRSGGVPQLLGASSSAFGTRTAIGVVAWDVLAWARGEGLAAQLVATGEHVGWLFTEASEPHHVDRLLGSLVTLVRRLARERDGATAELVERYEEISLLYAIGELLGTSTSVEDVADTLLRELAITIGASRAVFLRSDRSAGTLVPIATRGIALDSYPTIDLQQASHIAVRAYRNAGVCTEEGIASIEADAVLAEDGGALMAVALTRPSTGMGITGTHQIPVRRGTLIEPRTAVPLGVLLMAGRTAGQPFTAGDRKLAMAVGTQIGIAMHNASLMGAVVERQQLAREMALAHELQLKLLPNPATVGPEARAAARLVAAESVGGDFFLLARLDRDRTGVLIGDVSGHGYQSALVMALALSAAAIHMQAAFDPSIALEAVRQSLDDELTSTEMSITMCYAVIDSRAGEIRFANAGHPHAFRVDKHGESSRLAAVVPPMGFSNAPIEECVMSWRPDDRLVLFTDGVTDARNARGQALGERAVLDMLAGMTAGESPSDILGALFAGVETHVGGSPQRDDIAAVVVDRCFGGAV